MQNILAKIGKTARNDFAIAAALFATREKEKQRIDGWPVQTLGQRLVENATNQRLDSPPPVIAGVQLAVESLILNSRVRLGKPRVEFDTCLSDFVFNA